MPGCGPGARRLTMAAAVDLGDPRRHDRLVEAGDGFGEVEAELQGPGTAVEGFGGRARP